jgi:hypothetical protein
VYKSGNKRRTRAGLTRSFTVGTAVAALVGCIGLSTTLVTNASASTGADGKGVMVMVGPTGNMVEMVDPDQSTYVPDIAGASTADVDKAQTLLDAVNHFCATHTVAGLKGNDWRPGKTLATAQTHLFNPDTKSKGLDPTNPRAALVYDGKVAGVMFNGTPLPYLGTIPRAHGHADMAMAVEMVHVYCTPNLQYAYTPNRQLGVMLPVFHLRLEIRPAIMNLSPVHLRAVRDKVRGYIGMAAAAKATVASKSGPDPVLSAMRDEIRRSLMLLSLSQLRSVWHLMQSY